MSIHTFFHLGFLIIFLSSCSLDSNLSSLVKEPANSDKDKDTDNEQEPITPPGSTDTSGDDTTTGSGEGDGDDSGETQTANILVTSPGSHYFWASGDNGESWEEKEFLCPLHDNLSCQSPNKRIRATVFKHGKLYVGMGAHDGYSHPAQGHGLAISGDLGETYTIKDTSDGLAHNHVLSLFITDHGHIYVGSAYGGLSISKDDGESFEVKAIPSLSDLHTRISAIYVDEDNTIFVGLLKTHHHASGGLYKSIDGGDSWSKIDDGVPSQTIHTIVKDYASNRLYLSVGNFGLRFSDNNGDSWQTLAVGNGRARGIFPTPNGEVYVGTTGIPSNAAGSYILEDYGSSVHKIENHLFEGLSDQYSSGQLHILLHDPETNYIYMNIPNGGAYRGILGQKNEPYQKLNNLHQQFRLGIIIKNP